jgi:hypothetical protein
MTKRGVNGKRKEGKTEMPVNTNIKEIGNG